MCCPAIGAKRPRRLWQLMAFSVPVLMDSEPLGRSPSVAPMVARYEALVRVSEALRRYHDRDILFRSLARELRPVVRFDFLGLAFYDERVQTLDLRVLEVSGEPIPPPVLPVEESLTYWVVKHQKPLVIPVLDAETRFGEGIAYLRRQGVRSTCSLPLITPRQPIGMLLAGSGEPHTYDAEDVTFLSLVANQVALAIDDAMNYGALQNALALERDGRQSLDASDELLRALSTVLDIREVFPKVSEIAQAVLPHDLLTFTFQDHEGGIVLQAASNPLEPLPARLKLADNKSVGDGVDLVLDLEEEVVCR